MRERRVRMCPLRAINRISRSFHPTEITLSSAARCLEIFSQRVARLTPLGALIAGPGLADRLLFARSYIDQKNSFVGMIRVAEHFGSFAIGRDVPSVEIRNRRDVPRVPGHSPQCKGPD